ncbi:hypothetical protein [Stenotrophomonas acidaminiphila]|uniref:hypothetical protein n=1 Tax=Stenotrophomonas acidaminiphila TaxID=128780 RepID=UPI0028B093C9|nr:hypothetical protein [Stenotrophomonas acidaminiphila]
MSPDTWQLLTLGAVGLTAATNAVIAALIWQQGAVCEIRIQQPSAPLTPNPSLHDEAASCTCTAMGGTALPDVSDQARLARNCHLRAGLEAQWKPVSTEVVVGNDDAFRPQTPTQERDLRDAHGHVSEVGHFNTSRPCIHPRDVHAHEAHAQSYGVTPNHPIGVKHTERGTDYSDAQSDRLGPVHTGEHSRRNGTA